MADTIVKAFKTELRPNEAQALVLGRWCGASRYIYNWGLAKRIEAYTERGETLSHYSQDKAATQLKKEEDHAWLNEIPRRVIYFALRDLDRAYKNFFRRVKEGGPPGFPRFKSRGRSRSSFTLYANDFKVATDSIRFPKLGWVRLKEKGYIPVDAIKYGEMTVSERAGRWFVAVVCEVPHVRPGLTGETIAVHPGVRVHMTVSDGTRAGNPGATDLYAKRLARLQRKLARQKKGSANREKTKAQIAKLHYRIASIREDATHKATHMVTAKKRPERIVLQDWDVKGMLEAEAADLPRRVRAKIRRGIADAAMSEMIRQIKYKADWARIELSSVPRSYPVTLRCSSCGEVKDKMGMTETVYRCTSCDAVVDREENAVQNLIAWLDRDIEGA